MNEAKMNRLSVERSPYLLQHQNNPVWWYPWGQEALAAAKIENKPIFLSIGYSTCHWCHVMENESFENLEVAQILNEHFIAIKVDREERPELDDIYMVAVQQIAGRGGWPMSVWLTPEGHPFYGGTYFPKETFVEILTKISQLWREDPALLKQDAVTMTSNIERAVKGPNKWKVEELGDSLFSDYLMMHKRIFDSQNGGFRGAPKFPQTLNLMTLLKISHPIRNADILNLVQLTMNKMSQGGIFDHLMGGFHRYSTDEIWLVPHFEKMLYDNALLGSLYLEASSYFKNKVYEQVAREVVDYVLRELMSSDGLFYSAQDADSQIPGKNDSCEGYFCTFSYEELVEGLTPQELVALENSYGVTPIGHFEKRNILHRQNVTPILLQGELESALSKIRVLRKNRPQPLLDSKVIVFWNGLMLATLAQVSRVMSNDNKKYLSIAERAGEFLYSNMWKNKVLYRCWSDGESRIRGYLEDYCGLVYAYLELFRATQNRQWLIWAEEIQQVQESLFIDKDNGGYYFTDGFDKTIILRNKDQYDGVMPSGNSQSALNLVLLYELTQKTEYKTRAENVFLTFSSELEQDPAAHSMMVRAIFEYVNLTKTFPSCTEEGCAIE